jgi:hypothetical protein
LLVFSGSNILIPIFCLPEQSRKRKVSLEQGCLFLEESRQSDTVQFAYIG